MSMITISDSESSGETTLEEELQAQAQEEKIEEEQQQSQEEEKLLANKFKTVEELEKSYLELQQLNSKKQQPPPKTPPKAPEEDNTKQSLEAIGIDFDKYSNELLNGGALSEASYQELATKGLPQQVVDAYIEGLKVSAEKEANAVYDLVGGADNYQEIIGWAKENLSAEDIRAFNSTLESANISQIKYAVRGLKAAYQEEKGNPPKNLLNGNTHSFLSGGGDIYESWAQVTVDMKDPRYEKDSAFRNKVQQKLERSKI